MRHPNEIIVNGKLLSDILESHQKWIDNQSNGERADLQGANLRGANLQGAYLRDVDLQGANLQGANLQGAYLRYANLRDVDLQGANLQDANLDFSCWPLWCGSLTAKVDDRLISQFLYHAICLIPPERRKDMDYLEMANRFHRISTGECKKLETT